MFTGLAEQTHQLGHIVLEWLHRRLLLDHAVDEAFRPHVNLLIIQTLLLRLNVRIIKFIWLLSKFLHLFCHLLRGRLCFLTLKRFSVHIVLLFLRDELLMVQLCLQCCLLRSQVTRLLFEVDVSLLSRPHRMWQLVHRGHIFHRLRRRHCLDHSGVDSVFLFDKFLRLYLHISDRLCGARCLWRLDWLDALAWWSLGRRLLCQAALIHLNLALSQRPNRPDAGLHMTGREFHRRRGEYIPLSFLILCWLWIFDTHARGLLLNYASLTAVEPGQNALFWRVRPTHLCLDRSLGSRLLGQDRVAVMSRQSCLQFGSWWVPPQIYVDALGALVRTAAHFYLGNIYLGFLHIRWFSRHCCVLLLRQLLVELFFGHVLDSDLGQVLCVFAFNGWRQINSRLFCEVLIMLLMLDGLFGEWCFLLRLLQKFVHPSLARLSFSVDVNRFNFWLFFLRRLWQRFSLVLNLRQWFFGANNLRLHHLKRFRVFSRVLHRVVYRFNRNLHILGVIGG